MEFSELKNLNLEYIYRRYARVRLDALIECYDFLNERRNVHDTLEMLQAYIYANSHLAFEDEMEPIVILHKRRSSKNHIKLGSIRGL